MQWILPICQGKCWMPECHLKWIRHSFCHQLPGQASEGGVRGNDVYCTPSRFCQVLLLGTVADVSHVLMVNPHRQGYSHFTDERNRNLACGSPWCWALRQCSKESEATPPKRTAHPEVTPHQILHCWFSPNSAICVFYEGVESSRNLACFMWNLCLASMFRY